MSIVSQKEKKLIVQVAVDTPINKFFDYIWEVNQMGCLPQRGMVISVPFGKKEIVGVVFGQSGDSEYELEKLKKVSNVAPIKPLSEDLMSLSEFCSKYYLKSVGEVLIPSIPTAWRQKEKWPLLLKEKRQIKSKAQKLESSDFPEINLHEEQKIAINALDEASKENKFKTFLLQGVTGSGKTSTYLCWIKKVLENPLAQVLIMVPEINLTPQLEENIRQNFQDKKIAILHSGLTERTRADAWAMTNAGDAQIILGTRMSIMASIPNLKAIVVDEEHDLSYKQQEGVRYSARDLAIWRAQKLAIPVLLVSATPSLETWHRAMEGRYKKLELKHRAANKKYISDIQVIDLKEDAKKAKINHGLSNHLLAALRVNLDKGQQSLVFINRRGYSPVLSCDSCGWLSDCTKCSAHMVLHKSASKAATLCCHHCGLMKFVPKSCPACGNLDLMPIGQGTQKIEAYLTELFPSAKILRIDADSTRKKGSAEELFGAIHDGDADIVVGTQMITKGHDYQKVSLVGVIDADASLFSQDYRAPERLFAQLMQVAGRAGRSEQVESASVIIQTRYPNSAPYQFLKTGDVDGFMAQVCEERKIVGLPPYSFQALVHAEHKTFAEAMQMLKGATQLAMAQTQWPSDVMVSDVVPRSMARVAGKERVQMLLESEMRQGLQHALEILQGALMEQNSKRKGVGWYIERDPVQL
jgi:primosomal protein N' (replication factor Y)